MRIINNIVIHSSATPEGKDYTIEQIKEWHLARGWKDVGYHVVIYRDGSVHQGRNDDKIGAGVAGHNRHSIHICYIGGVESKKVNGVFIAKDTRTNQQKEALRDLCDHYKNLYPKSIIVGHRDFKNANTLCPSFDALNEYAYISKKFNFH